MEANGYNIQLISTDRIFLDRENPRFAKLDSQSEIIKHLCEKEYVLTIAKDIVKNGLNPLEIFALIPDKKSEDVYTVAEGNRRLCAMKLLNDPELSPNSTLKKDFVELSREWDEIESLPSIVFQSRGDVKIWLDRIHAGLQGGIGRKSWNAEQITRFSGSNKNRLAQAILDFSEQNGIISAEDRKNKLTTVQRYLSNVLIKDALGIDASVPDDISRNRPSEDFVLLLKKFIDDLLKGVVNSRARKPEIDRYARTLNAIEGVSGERVPPHSIKASDKKGKKAKKSNSRAKKPTRPKTIGCNQEIQDTLEKVKSIKLQSLYYSICNIPLEDHTPLITIGVWSLLESLTALVGRNSTTDFSSFLSPSKLESYDLGNRKETKGLRNAISRIADQGNITKHHDTAANFSPVQLATDMDVLNPLIIKLVEDAISKKN